MLQARNCLFQEKCRCRRVYREILQDCPLQWYGKIPPVELLPGITVKSPKEICLLVYLIQRYFNDGAYPPDLTVFRPVVIQNEDAALLTGL